MDKDKGVTGQGRDRTREGQGTRPREGQRSDKGVGIYEIRKHKLSPHRDRDIRFIGTGTGTFSL
jgi:hypothetical protein